MDLNSTVFNLKPFLVLLSENANQGMLVCVVKCSSMFLPVTIHPIIFCTSSVLSNTATLGRQVRFDRFMETWLAKSCLRVQESQFY